MEIIRQLKRRPLRSFLTIFGVAFGIFAMTMMGGMSVFIDRMTDNSLAFLQNHLEIATPFSFGKATYGAAFSEDMEENINKIDGVKDVVPIMMIPIMEFSGGLDTFSIPLVIGLRPEQAAIAGDSIGLQVGRWLRADDEHGVILGNNIVTLYDFKLGQTQYVPELESEFTLIGVLNRTEGLADNFVILPLETVQAINNTPDQVTRFFIYPDANTDLETPEHNVVKQYPHLDVVTPEDREADLKSNLVMYDMILFFGSLMAGVIGIFSTSNTMLTAIYERKREIGVKKAVGATDFMILRDFLGESVFFGALGGVFGIGCGYLGIELLNTYTVHYYRGMTLFLFTKELALVAFGAALIFSACAGLLPAIRAARMQPVEALRNE
jgi:putative ABC transport system permease protein